MLLVTTKIYPGGCPQPDSVSKARASLTAAFRWWANTAETELQDLTGTILRHPGRRGRGARLKWAPIFVKTPKENSTQQNLALGWRWLEARYREVKCAVARLPVSQSQLPVLTEEFCVLTNEIIQADPIGCGTATDFDTQVGLFRTLLSKVGIIPCGWTWPLEDHTQWLLELEGQHSAVCEVAQVAVKAAKSESRQSWKAWVDEALDKGAKKMHTYSKVIPPWSPEVTLRKDGTVTADPLHLLQLQTEALQKC